LAATTALHRLLFVDAGIAGRGHRVNLMWADLKETGIAVLSGKFQGYNAVMITEDFAYRTGNSFLTGVAYDDNLVSNDDFYTPGEGLGGVTVTATRLSDNAVFTATMWASGGYSLRLAPGTYRVTASGGSLGGAVSASVVTIGSQNIKLDFTTDTVDPIQWNPRPVVRATGGSGTNDLVVRRSGENIQVFNNKSKRVLRQQPLASMEMLTIIGAANKPDVVRIDFRAGGAFVLAEGIVVDGGTGTQADTLLLRGTAGADTFDAETDFAVLNGLRVAFDGVERITLDGGSGDDSYQVSGLSANTTIVDAMGADTLDFSKAGDGIRIDLNRTLGQRQNIFALDLILKEWSSERSFEDRCRNLETGIADSANPKLGIIQLARNTTMNRRAAVLDDAANDVLLGGLGSDWFFDFPNDTSDRGPADR
jgi:hypothetical protein